VPEPELAGRAGEVRRGGAGGAGGGGGGGGGYTALYVEHVLQADRGADLDFLVGCRGSAVPRRHI
ncbi:MAG: hypothetical protein ACRD0L_16720, partial [Acidimicrobiales bacterium]